MLSTFVMNIFHFIYALLPTQKDLIVDLLRIHGISSKKRLVYPRNLINVANAEGGHWEPLPSIILLFLPDGHILLGLS